MHISLASLLLLESPQDAPANSLLASCKQQVESDFVELLLQAIKTTAIIEVPRIWALTVAMDIAS